MECLIHLLLFLLYLKHVLPIPDNNSEAIFTTDVTKSPSWKSTHIAAAAVNKNTDWKPTTLALLLHAFKIDATTTSSQNATKTLHSAKRNMIMTTTITSIVTTRSIRKEANTLSTAMQNTTLTKTTTIETVSKKDGATKTSGWTVFLFVFVVILFVVGVTGNLMIIVTIIRDKSLQNLQNYLVFNLAITDLFTLIVVLPLAMIMWHIAWPFGKFTCKYLMPLCDVLPPVSVFTLVAISIDRYRAITMTNTLLRQHSLKFGALCIGGIWLFCYLLVGLPMSFFVQLVNNQHCIPVFQDPHWQKATYTLRMLLLYLAPSIIIFVCYLGVNKALAKSMRLFNRSVYGKSRIFGLKRQKRVMSMFFAIFLTFGVCYLPLNIYILLLVYVTARDTLVSLTTYMEKIAIVFSLANSVCSPIILYMLSMAYRNSFQRLLPFLTHCTQAAQKRDTDSKKSQQSSSSLWNDSDEHVRSSRKKTASLCSPNLKKFKSQDTLISTIGLFLSSFDRNTSKSNNDDDVNKYHVTFIKDEVILDETFESVDLPLTAAVATNM